MKTIPLTKGAVAMVDDTDYEALSKTSWCLTNRGYASRGRRVSGKSVCELMHRVVLGAPKGLYVDHINGNPLDNRRANLRLCTPSQNPMNRRKSHNNTSGFKGVYRRRRRWQVSISVGGELLYVGLFKSKEDAARAYDAAALKYHGEFANLNFRT